jgi:hypothetical protein
MLKTDAENLYEDPMMDIDTGLTRREFWKTAGAAAIVVAVPIPTAAKLEPVMLTAEEREELWRVLSEP